MIVGFDVSTRCIGYTILNDDGSLCDVNYIWLDKIKNEYDKLDSVKNHLDNSIKISGSVSVYVEAPLQRSNNQNVVNILQRWNGMICVLLYQVFKTHPILIPEMEIRKINKIKIPKGIKGLDKKKYVLQHVRNLGIVPEHKWQLKKTGSFKDFCFDMSDSVCVAKAGFINGNL